MCSQIAGYCPSCELSAGDRIAHDVATSDEREEDSDYNGIAFTGLISCFEEARLDRVVVPVFKMTDFANMYSSPLEQPGTGTAGRVHSTRLEERLLAYVPNMEAHKHDRDVVLVYRGGLRARIWQNMRGGLNDIVAGRVRAQLFQPAQFLAKCTACLCLFVGGLLDSSLCV